MGNHLPDSVVNILLLLSLLVGVILLHDFLHLAGLLKFLKNVKIVVRLYRLRLVSDYIFHYFREHFLFFIAFQSLKWCRKPKTGKLPIERGISVGEVDLKVLRFLKVLGRETESLGKLTHPNLGGDSLLLIRESFILLEEFSKSSEVGSTSR